MTGQPTVKILHAVDNNILKNISILREHVGMAEEIYAPSVPHLQRETVRHKIQHVEPIIIPNLPKFIHDKYKKATQWCDLKSINGIGFLNKTLQNIMFSKGSTIKNRKTIKFKMELNRSTSYTCNVVSKSGVYMLTSSLKIYYHILLILEYP